MIHELRLVGSECVQEVSVQVDGSWSVQESGVVKRDGAALSFIPFVFHGASHSLPGVDKLPLADVIAVNLDHYRLDADHKHGMHFTALPTAWMAGFDKDAELRIGSIQAWVSETTVAPWTIYVLGRAG